MFGDIDLDQAELNKNMESTYQRLRSEVLGLLRLIINTSVKGGAEDRTNLMGSVWQLAVAFHDQIEAIYHFCDTAASSSAPSSSTTPSPPPTPKTAGSGLLSNLTPPPPPSMPHGSHFSNTLRGGMAAYAKASSILGTKSILLLVLESHICGPLLRDRLWPFPTDHARACANPTMAPVTMMNNGDQREARSVSLYGNGKKKKN
jgi:hypothetical protein